MRTKYVLLAAIIAIACATTARADIPIVQADTVFQGFPGGEVSGIVFGPTGETVIVMHDAQPVEINIKTKQIVREFEKVPNALGDEPLLFIDKIKNYIGGVFLSTEYLNGKPFNGEIFWDITTGKIIMAIPNIVLLTDGKKYYSYFLKDKKQYLGLFDINSYKFIDSVEFDQGFYHGQQTKFPAGLGIIPNSNKLIIGANIRYENESGLSQLYLLDFDTKQYTKILIPYQDGTKSSNIRSIEVSETGKYFCVDINIPYNDSTDGNSFYNNKNKYLFTESLSHINKQNPNPNIGFSFERPVFISDEYMIAVVREWSNLDNSELNSYTGLFRISDRKTIKLVKFDKWWHLCYNDSDIAITNPTGTVILLNKFALPVNDDKSINAQEQAEYQNGVLTIISTTNLSANINIIDYQGNTVFAMKDKYFQTGRNSFAIDFPMSNGIYFAIVKTTHGDYSYKFIVNR